MLRPLQFLLRFLHIGLVLICLASYLSPLIDPELCWPIAALGLFAPFLWGLLLLFGIYWLYRRNKIWWLSAITLLLGWQIISTAIAFPLKSSNKTPSKTFTIASLNGYDFGRRVYRKNIDTIAQYLAKLDADILCLQEFPLSKYGPKLEEAIKAKGYPHFHRIRDGGFAIFSRLPLSNRGIHYFANRGNGFSWCEVTYAKQTFRLYNIHLQSNTISQKAVEITTEGDIRSRKTWSTIKLMFSRYGRSTQMRTQQVRHILAELRNSPYPVLLVGDFNDVPASYVYRILQKNLQDAHLLEGLGLGATYAGPLPGLRIDYVMPDHNFKVFDFQVRDCFFSDHKAIRATLELK